MNNIVQSARKYIGTPFRHRGRSARFLDCAGLGIRVYSDLGVNLPDIKIYGREPHNEGLIRHITDALGEPVAISPITKHHLMVGDIAVFKFDINPHHVGIIADYIFGGFSVIHACGHTERVIEQRLSEDRIKKITHLFRRPV